MTYSIRQVQELNKVTGLFPLPCYVPAWVQLQLTSKGLPHPTPAPEGNPRSPQSKNEFDAFFPNGGSGSEGARLAGEAAQPGGWGAETGILALPTLFPVRALDY